MNKNLKFSLSLPLHLSLLETAASNLLDGEENQLFGQVLSPQLSQHLKVKSKNIKQEWSCYK